MLAPVGGPGTGALVAQPTVSVANSAASTATTSPALRVLVPDFVVLIGCVLSLASNIDETDAIASTAPAEGFSAGPLNELAPLASGGLVSAIVRLLNAVVASTRSGV
jgi:hypothetical protein